MAKSTAPPGNNNSGTAGPMAGIPQAAAVPSPPWFDPQGKFTQILENTDIGTTCPNCHKARLLRVVLKHRYTHYHWTCVHCPACSRTWRP